MTGHAVSTGHTHDGPALIGHLQIDDVHIAQNVHVAQNVHDNQDVHGSAPAGHRF